MFYFIFTMVEYKLHKLMNNNKLTKIRLHKATWLINQLTNEQS